MSFTLHGWYWRRIRTIADGIREVPPLFGKLSLKCLGSSISVAGGPRQVRVVERVVLR